MEWVSAGAVPPTAIYGPKEGAPHADAVLVIMMMIMSKVQDDLAGADELDSTLEKENLENDLFSLLSVCVCFQRSGSL